MLQQICIYVDAYSVDAYSGHRLGTGAWAGADTILSSSVHHHTLLASAFGSFTFSCDNWWKYSTFQSTRTAKWLQTDRLGSEIFADPFSLTLLY
jgi:hypothetical protein